MKIRYFISRRFEDEFNPEIEISRDEFGVLSNHARKWVSVLEKEESALSVQEGELNLSYNIEDNSVTPRNFGPMEVVQGLNKKVNTVP